LLDFLTRDLLATGFAALREALAGADVAEYAVPAVRSSARPAVMDFRRLI
jgi:hypothetical protein